MNPVPNIPGPHTPQFEPGFLSLFEFVPDALIMADAAGRIVLANPQATSMFGWSNDELIGQMIELLIPEAARTGHVTLRANYQQSPQARPMGSNKSDLTALRRDGTEMQVEISLGPIETSAGKLIIAAIRNVTSRKTSERNALRSQRLESLGTMASGIAHDLNNTFQPILMVLEMLRADYPEKVTEFLTIAEQSARRGSEMVLQLLTFAKGSKGSRILIEPRHLLKEIEKIVRNTFSKSIQLRVNYQEDPGTLLGDPTQLHQVLLNLCVNARDAMADGGTLTIAVDTLECDTTFVEFFSDAVPGTYIRIRISDTGCGIPPELIDRIFEPFFTTKPPEMGTGLGLSAAIGIIRAHGGFLRVRSEVGTGSQFELYLPKVAGQSQSEETTTELTFHGGGELCLVVDDEQGVRDMLKIVLQKLELRVITAVDGSEALIRIGEYGEEIKFVLTDVNMPVIDGLALARSLRKILPQARIIAITGVASDQRLTELKSLGVDGTIIKPFNRRKLIGALNGHFPTD
jgi:two-component system, cell cycle sensor histidine kinase and response regulator CckA